MLHAECICVLYIIPILNIFYFSNNYSDGTFFPRGKKGSLLLFRGQSCLKGMNKNSSLLGGLNLNFVLILYAVCYVTIYILENVGILIYPHNCRPRKLHSHNISKQSNLSN